MSAPNLKHLLANRKLKLGHSVFEFNSRASAKSSQPPESISSSSTWNIPVWHRGRQARHFQLPRGNLPVMVRPPSTPTITSRA